MTTTFAITRANGQSNSDVLTAYVRPGEPGRLYGYDELMQVLSVGASRPFDVRAVQSAVRAANPRLLREHQRVLHAVKLQGYRLAFASEHTMLAGSRQRRADKQLKAGLEILRNVKWEEMTENERRAHTGQLLVSEAIWASLKGHEARLRRVETALASLVVPKE